MRRRLKIPFVLPLLLCAACADMGAAKNAAIMKDYGTARANLAQLAERGFPQAQTQLGEIYMNGLGTPRDPARALALFHQAEAAENWPEAILDIGKAYRAGSGVPRDAARAKAYFMRARTRGSAGACVQLGLLEQDAGKLKAAESLFNEGLSAGDRGALGTLGDLRVVQGRLKDAEELFSRALAAGDDNAWLDMGRLHMLQRKFARAERDFRNALEKTGDTDAYLRIGDAEIPQGKFAEAEDNYKWALQMQIPAAAARIGDMHRNGSGRPADLPRALSWYYRARALGMPGIGVKIARTEKKLRPEELARALRLFDAWKRGKRG